MLVETALGDEHCDQQSFDNGTEQVAAAELFDREPQRCSGADQEDHRDDAAVTARRLAAGLTVQFAVEERNRAAGEHDRMLDTTEHCWHVAKYPVDCEAGDEQEQSIGAGGRHRALRPRRESGRGDQ